MSIKKTKLSSGRKVEIKEMDLDSVDACTDITTINLENGEVRSVGNMSKARTAWIRNGLVGGEFEKFSKKGAYPNDSVLKQLTEDEKNELSSMIQEYQKVGE
jgi:hypothetical protein